MKMHLTVKTRKGFYLQKTVEVSTIKAGLDKVLPILDKAPDEIDGERIFDWTEMTVEFSR